MAGVEAEARTILSAAVEAEQDEAEPNLAEAIRRRFAPRQYLRPHMLAGENLARIGSENSSSVATPVATARCAQSFRLPPKPWGSRQGKTLGGKPKRSPVSELWNLS